VERFLEMLAKILRKEYKGRYTQDTSTGTFSPDGYTLDAGKYFSFSGRTFEDRDRTYSEAS
jgi:hypothetical protein